MYMYLPNLRMLVLAEFLAVGEVLEPFATPCCFRMMRKSHYGPPMPVPINNATPSRFDGPPRVISLGFQLAEGKLIGPRYMFDGLGFDEVRPSCNTLDDRLRHHGPFEPHRLPMDEMEYTTLPELMDKLQNRLEDLPH
jgi:fructose 1,6-bisphosphate aldolase/phosphatase